MKPDLVEARKNLGLSLREENPILGEALEHSAKRPKNKMLLLSKHCSQVLGVANTVTCTICKTAFQCSLSTRS